jgi:hypothetical protein
MANQIAIKQGEAKPFTFSITKSGSPVTDAVLTFQVKVGAKDTTPVISKVDVDFNKDDKDNGNYVLSLTVSDTKDLKAISYTAELKTVYDSGKVDKSYDIPFIVERAVIIDT